MSYFSTNYCSNLKKYDYQDELKLTTYLPSLLLPFVGLVSHRPTFEYNLPSPLQPVLYCQAGDFLEVARVSGDDVQAPGQGNSPDSHVGISERCPTPFQFGPQFSVGSCCRSIKGKHRQMGEEHVFQEIEQRPAPWSSRRDPYTNSPRVMLEVNCCSTGTVASLAISVVEGVGLNRLLRISVSSRYIKPPGGRGGPYPVHASGRCRR
ncbi:MAG: hypothetical protein HW384_423 [Dehalococcoidia bacterium]|nr:hypothetical protein [Dehalococcoidia bacterium]